MQYIVVKKRGIPEILELLEVGPFTLVTGSTLPIDLTVSIQRLALACGG